METKMELWVDQTRPMVGLDGSLGGTVEPANLQGLACLARLGIRKP
jgi:hypothetical protein